MSSESFVPPDAELRELLRRAKTIAVVGLSDNPMRPSHGVALYLHQSGYRIIPVNPNLKELWGLRAYADLRSLQDLGLAIDIVDVFRRPEDVDPIVDQAIQIGAKAIWFQEGVVNPPAAARAQASGLIVVMDRCARTEHVRLIG